VLAHPAAADPLASDPSQDPDVEQVTLALAAEVMATSIRKAAIRLGIARDTVKRVLRGGNVHPGTIALVRAALVKADWKS